MNTKDIPANPPKGDLLGLGAMLPACWTLTETLDANQTTSFGHLWFTNPKNSAWEPLYRRTALDRLLAHSHEVHEHNAELLRDAMRWRWFSAGLKDQAAKMEASVDAAIAAGLSGECSHDWRVTQQGVTYHDCRCAKCGLTKRESWD